MIEFTCEAIWSWTFIGGKFLNQFQFQYLWLVCSYFLFLPGLALDGCIFLKLCPFLLGCSFYWLIVACSTLSGSFVFLWCQFSFLILLIRIQLGLSGLMCHIKLVFSLLVFCLDGLSIGESSVLKSSTIILLLLISPFIAISFCLIHWGALSGKTVSVNNFKWDQFKIEHQMSLSSTKVAKN